MNRETALGLASSALDNGITIERIIQTYSFEQTKLLNRFLAKNDYAGVNREQIALISCQAYDIVTRHAYRMGYLHEKPCVSRKIEG